VGAFGLKVSVNFALWLCAQPGGGYTPAAPRWRARGGGHTEQRVSYVDGAPWPKRGDSGVTCTVV